jgi:hypothetical protein
MISSLVAMSLIDPIGAANISSSMPKRGVMFPRRAMTTIMWCAAEPDASAFRQLRNIHRDPPCLIARGIHSTALAIMYATIPAIAT